MDDVFHGMSLGKNGDVFRRLSRSAEDTLLAAESLSALMGLFGRPYPHWDVYPTWELEEAWRELLSAQHHDNDECEGLCGHVGKFSYERSLSLSREVLNRALALLAKRVNAPAGRIVAYNPLGWTRTAAVTTPGGAVVLAELPACGYAVVDSEAQDAAPVVADLTPDTASLSRGPLRVTVDRKRGVITQIVSTDFPQGVLADGLTLCDLQMTHGGAVDTFDGVEVIVSGERITIVRTGRGGAAVTIELSLAPEIDAVDVRYSANGLPRPDPWLRAGLQTRVATGQTGARLIHDQPYAVSEIRAEGKYLRKYPTGEWMTSPQVFEDIINPFTSYSLLDIADDNRGLLYLHDGSQAMQRVDGDGLAVTNILTMYDAWDEDYFIDSLDARFRLVPHGRLNHSDRWKLAQEFRRPALTAVAEGDSSDLPQRFAPLAINRDGVAVTALYRETEENARGLDDYAGTGMGFPFVIRLVELNGSSADVELRLPGRVGSLYKTNLLGETAEQIDVSAGDSPYSTARVSLRPREIATLYADIEMGRKMPRNLDEFRFVWATVHRVEGHE